MVGDWSEASGHLLRLNQKKIANLLSQGRAAEVNPSHQPGGAELQQLSTSMEDRAVTPMSTLAFLESRLAADSRIVTLPRAIARRPEEMRPGKFDANACKAV